MGEHQVPPERLDRRGHRRAAPADPRLDRGAAGRGPRPDGAGRPGRRAAAALPRGARRGLRAPGRGAPASTSSRRHRRSWPTCSRTCSCWTAASACAARCATASTPAGPPARSPTARARRRRSASWPPREGIDLAESFAYSDSESDLPMMRAVGHPVAVNPDRELERVARQEGWRIMRFDKLGRRLQLGGRRGERGARRRRRRLRGRPGTPPAAPAAAAPLGARCCAARRSPHAAMSLSARARPARCCCRPRGPRRR